MASEAETTVWQARQATSSGGEAVDRVIDRYRGRRGVLTLWTGPLPSDAGYVVVAGNSRGVMRVAEVCDGGHLRVDDQSGRREQCESPATLSARGVPDGSVMFGSEPVLQLFGPLDELIRAEPELSYSVRVATSTATAGVRLVEAAGRRPVFLLRATGHSAVKAADEAAAVGGLHLSVPELRGGASVTSAGARLATVLDGGEAVFRALIAQHPAPVLPLRSYGAQLVHAAMRALKDDDRCGDLPAVLLDGEHLAEHAAYVRRVLDAHDQSRCAIIASVPPDAKMITDVGERAPIDMFVVTAPIPGFIGAAGHPLSLRAVLTGLGPPDPGLQVYRRHDFGGDVVATGDEPPLPDAEPLLQTLDVRADVTNVDGAAVACAAARERALAHRRRLAETHTSARLHHYPVATTQLLVEHRRMSSGNPTDVKPALAVD